MMMQSSNSPVGTWKLVSFQFEVEGGERRNVFDEHPVGVIIITAEGHLLTLITASNRAPTATASELFDSMMSYSGLYRLQGNNRLITRVDSAWNPAWVGTEQTRSFKRDGDTLSLMAPDFHEHPKFPGQRVRGIAIWHKE
jgi:Lipocalin-like domain